MKKIILSLILLLTLTGCWNYNELNEFSIVSGVSIDKSGDEYEMSVLISNSPKSNSSESNSSESQVVVYSGKGESIFSALKQIGLISPSELYFGSFSILVISEEVAKDGINNAIDFFVRYPNTRKNFYVVLSKNSKAKDTLKIMTPLSSFPSQQITDNVKTTTELQGIIASTNFNDLLSTILSNGTELSINCIEIIGDVKEGSSKENIESSEPKTYTKLGNLGIFKGDKLIDWANRDESLGINIINGATKEMFLDIEYKEGYVVIDSTSFSSNVSIELKNDQPVVNIELSGEARIIEVKGDIDLENSKVIEEIQKKSNKKIKKRVEQAIELAIKNKTDVFGFGQMFYQKYPKYFKSVKDKWNDNLDEIEIKIKSDLMLKNKVSSKNSLEEIND
ncbi:MAG: Ger(x)C family spore germination protein [Bacilli bacterium]|nr:Ger(x)C family spore germination protein [Bacilli bacterium]